MVSPVGSVGASASQRCPLDTCTLALSKILLENLRTDPMRTSSDFYSYYIKYNLKSIDLKKNTFCIKKRT